MASSSSSSAPSAPAKLRHGSSADEYNTWKEPILRLLGIGGFLGMIDGSIPPPPGTGVGGYKEWERIDGAVKDFILNALSDELLLNLIPAVKTSRDIWLELEAMFTQPTPSQGDAGAYQRLPLELYKAALKGDWDTTEAILDQNPGVAKARAYPNLDTVLHIAAGTGKATVYLQKLLEHITDDSVLALTNFNGYTPLFLTARLGNLESARVLISRCRNLLYTPDKHGAYPVSKAPMSGHRPTVEFFMSETVVTLETNPYNGDSGVMLLCNLINWDFIDIALKLIADYPDLGGRKHPSGQSALRTLALKDALFASGAPFGSWERLIYNSFMKFPKGIQMEMEQLSSPNAADIENSSCCGTPISRGKSKFGLWQRVLRNLRTALHQVIMQLVPRARWIRDQKVKHDEARKLAKCLCEQLGCVSDREASVIYVDAMLKAAKLGIHEVVEVIVESFPIAIYSADASTQRYLFHIAVENRSEKVFNLIHQMSGHKRLFSSITDITGNTILHRVACLAPSNKLNLVSGAALQMQRELQWFKEVEKFVELNERVKPNDDGKTANMIFTEDHANLKAEGEKWMKDTANSCSIAAALIATVVFAAAITVPGGNAESGYPLFVKSGAFVIFAISDAVSLFTSSTSLLMFLSILTSRYAEEDFLQALPKRLCVGLFTLFLSILFMMVAFSATIFLVFGEKSAWVLIPVALLACLPVTSFVLLQFPLLVDVISSTYGRGIFGKQSDRPFH